MQGRTILGVGGVVLLGGAVLFVALGKQSGSQPRPEVPAAAQPVAQGPARATRNDSVRDAMLEAKVAALGSEVKALRESAAEAKPEPSAAPSPEESELDDETQAAAMAERMRKQTSLLDKTLAEEPADAEWSNSAQQTVLTAYSGSEFEGAKVGAVCKSSMCKIEVDLSESKEPDATLRMLALRAPWQGVGFTRFNTETRRADYYLAREQFDLPMAEGETRTP